MVIAEVVVHLPEAAMNRVGAGDSGVYARPWSWIYGEKTEESTGGLPGDRRAVPRRSRGPERSFVKAEARQFRTEGSQRRGSRLRSGQASVNEARCRIADRVRDREVVQDRISDRVELPFVIERSRTVCLS